jgi:D-glycero-alpha-D-manno-heptose-7-phosphate kinase
MKKVTARAPVRADLAGGTLDLWPLYLFHPGARTVNVAISYHAESEVEQTGDDAIEIHLTDQQYEKRYESMAELAADPKAALIHRALEYFHLNGIRITTRTDAPRGSGLGGSSALTVTLVRALSEIAGHRWEGDALIELVRDLETRLLAVPAGIQDYYPPVYGGLAALHLNPGKVVRHPIALPVDRLAEHMLLHYTGVAHFSGTNNWDIYKRQIDGKKKVHKGLSKIAESAIEMERALEAGNMEAAGAALGHEWANRKALIDGISTPEIEQAIDAALAAGAWAGKVCGAGGGGCIIFLMPPNRRDAVRDALGSVPGRVIDAHPVAHGLTIDRPDDTQTTRRRMKRPRKSSIEQLFVSGGEGEYRPHFLVEAIVTMTEPRSGTQHVVSRSYVAKILSSDGSVDWHDARLMNADTLDLRAVPDPERSIHDALTPEVLMQAAGPAEEAFRQFLIESERLHLFHNPAFDLWSQPGEERGAFVQRCREEATRRIEEESERLESTFRRRIDQVKERSQRDSRELDANEETPHDERGGGDVNLAWGQTLYNITSGKPAAVAEPSHSVRESDYLGKIAQISRSWKKELETIREELDANARAVEEITVVPSPKNIEVTKYLILWAAGLP